MDHLSREATITPADRIVMRKVGVNRPWGALGRWLDNLVLDWDLPTKILEDVKKLCELQE